MNNTFKILNQLYYLVYTIIILLAITGYFLNLKSVLNFDIPKSIEMVLLSVLMLISLMAIGYFAYSLITISKFKRIQNQIKREKQYLASAKIRLLLIGVSLVAGVVCLYLVRSEIVLYSIAVSGVLLFLSKPSEAKIDDILSE